MTRFYFTDAYNRDLEQIEDFILESTQSLAQVESFLGEHDKTLRFIEHNPKTPAIHLVTGDQSWIFGVGRYRVFFRVVVSEDVVVYLIHLVDNRRANLEVYPGNSLPTYEDGDAD